MIVNEVVTGVIAILIGYLLGSVPAAYIITRVLTGKDIRKLGGGNVGARNVFREVGKAAGIGVAIFDIAKGAAAVVIAYLLLGTPSMELIGAPQIFVLAAGLLAVVGHMWSIYLKFTGGNGLATAIGVLSIVMTWELIIVLALTLLLAVITRNFILSLNISLLSLPISSWFLEEQWLPYVTFSVLLILIMVLNFIPTARAALVKAGSGKKLSAELLRINKASKKTSKKKRR